MNFEFPKYDIYYILINKKYNDTKKPLKTLGENFCIYQYFYIVSFEILYFFDLFNLNILIIYFFIYFLLLFRKLKKYRNIKIKNEE